MQGHQPTPIDPGPNPLILRTDPRWFLTRGIGWGLLFPLLLRALGAARYSVLFPVGFALLWLVFRNAYIALDSQGFTYRSVVLKVSHRWADVERFVVVEQRLLGFIPIIRHLGWNYSPTYKYYKRLAIPRALARWGGSTEGKCKPVGFNVPALTAVMNQYLQRSRTAAAGTPPTDS